MSDDLIKRSDALNFKVSNGINVDGILYVPYGEVERYLESLPSAKIPSEQERWLKGE